MVTRWLNSGEYPSRQGASLAASCLAILPLALLCTILSGCGGGGGGGVSDGSSSGGSCSLSASSNSAFCGTVTGLPGGQSVTLGVETSDAGSNTATVSADGGFVIYLLDPLTLSSTWNVYVEQEPKGTTCTVTNGGQDIVDNGVRTTSVDGIAVSCAPAVYYTVGGTLTGLDSGTQVTLQNSAGDGSESLTLSTNGAFTFPTALRGGVEGYNVIVTTQPHGLSCTVSNGFGLPIVADVINVSVTCSPAAYYTVGGTLTGLGSGGQITLQNYNPVKGDTEQITLTADGSFTFPTSIRGGVGGYQVTVSGQPSGQACAVASGEGAPITANVTNISVTCADDIGGTLSGLDGGGQITLVDNGGDPLVLTANGSFTFSSLVAAGGAYDVTVDTHPVGQECSVANGSGSASGPVSAIQVACMTVEQVLHTFAGSDGANPAAGLIADSSGNFYGTTTGGGIHGEGAVFELAPNGSGGYTESVLYSFAGGKDGAVPEDALVRDSAGDLYGTTSGGSYGYWSTVFALAPNGTGGYTESILHLFSGTPDGNNPQAGVLVDSSGNLYGTTPSGGNLGGGTVFELAPNGTGGYNESITHSFGATGDGTDPNGALIRDSSGDLYGTAADGGADGDGVVFELTPDGSGGYTESVVYSFTGGAGGASPRGALILDGSGDLYGTAGGGLSSICLVGCGVVFELSPNGSGGYTESILHRFAGGSDGAGVNGGLLMDAAGDLYGTTALGGNGSGTSGGDGTVYELSPDGSGGYTETILYGFLGGTDGMFPNGGLVMDSAGDLYGTTNGISGDGNVFEIFAH
jgi:uncharacterized repeat protein (TIGR03803 family)